MTKIIMIKKWGKRVGGTVDPQKPLKVSTFKEYIANKKIHDIFEKQSFFNLDLSYEKT